MGPGGTGSLVHSYQDIAREDTRLAAPRPPTVPPPVPAGR
jgi:hypothetical protein